MGLFTNNVTIVENAMKRAQGVMTVGKCLKIIRKALTNSFSSPMERLKMASIETAHFYNMMVFYTMATTEKIWYAIGLKSLAGGINLLTQIQ